MDMFVVRGGRPLQGSVSISGAKNAALPAMAAAILADGPLRLTNVPDLADVRTLSEVLRQLGMQVARTASDEVTLEAVEVRQCTAPYELVRRMRASFCVLGPLLARRGRACVSLPGGCNLGSRPVDLHLRGLAALGADLRTENGYVIAQASRLRGARVSLAGPFGSTVTGTCNILSAATLARGVTVIEGAACEPEVVDLAACLAALGARIEGAGTSTIRVEGVDQLGGGEHRIIPDRIEAATFLCAAAITGGDVRLKGADSSHLTAVLGILQEIGAEVRCEPDAPSGAIHIQVTRALRGVHCTALPYPGFPTDVQQLLTAVLTQAHGESLIEDRVFPERFMHVPELNRMGATIRRTENRTTIAGPSPLSGAPVMASDLRGGAALVLAALAARGESCVRRVYHLDRGYERFEEKLRGLGADVERVRDVPAAQAAIQPPHFELRKGLGERTAFANLERRG